MPNDTVLKWRKKVYKIKYSKKRQPNGNFHQKTCQPIGEQQ